MKKKTPAHSSSSALPVSKQTAGGVSGAILGSVVAGPIGAVAGAIAGTIMGNRAAKGKTLIPASAVAKTKDAVKAVKNQLPDKVGRTLKSTFKAKPQDKRASKSTSSGGKTLATKRSVEKVKKSPTKRK